MVELTSILTYDAEADCYYFYADPKRMNEEACVGKTVRLENSKRETIGAIDLDHQGKLFGVELFGWKLK